MCVKSVGTLLCAQVGVLEDMQQATFDASRIGLTQADNQKRGGIGSRGVGTTHRKYTDWLSLRSRIKGLDARRAKRDVYSGRFSGGKTEIPVLHGAERVFRTIRGATCRG